MQKNPLQRALTDIVGNMRAKRALILAVEAGHSIQIIGSFDSQAEDMQKIRQNRTKL